MQYNPRKRTNEADEYILAVLKESKESHNRTMQTGVTVQNEIIALHKQAIYDAITGYKGGVIIWVCVIISGYLFIK